MNFFDKYFVFSHSEKRGILLFLILILLLCFIYWFIPRYFVPEPTDYSAAIAKMEQAHIAHEKETESKRFLFDPNTISKDSLMLLGFSSKQAWNLINFRTKVKAFTSKKELKKLYAMTDSLFESVAPLIQLDNSNKSEPKSDIKQKDVERKLFSFDPNTLPLDSLKLLGLSAKTAQTLIRFREKSGGFRSKSDLWKVYGLKDSQIKELESYVVIKEQSKVYEEKEIQVKNIDLNKASKAELMAAKGIGNAFSDRIIDYRNRIGDFVSTSQLQEVFGIDQEWLEKYEGQFSANKEDIQRIKINSVTFKELLSHPYFSYSQTQLIINYRAQHGDFNSLEQIRENNLIKPKHYRKIVPYLTIQ
ncbi:MAG: helix-hairpin-helix domain-containing protein [Flavobacteriales bacterium]